MLGLALHAEEAGRVTHVSGPLFALKADGSRQVLAGNSAVEAGDTLLTEDKTYAQVKFNDQAVVTLRPGTQVKIESFSFQQAAPEKDNAVFNLFKGALRTISGLVGKRGNQDAYRLQTPTATIGIRGTTFLALYVPDTAEGSAEAQAVLDDAFFEELATRPLRFAAVDTGTLTDAAPITGLPLLLAQNSPSPPGGGLAPGLYVHVIDGLVNLSNRGGSLQFSAGQFGFTGSIVQPPVVVPSNPGIQFSPPPAFSTSSGGQTGGDKSKSGSVDCVVR